RASRRRPAGGRRGRAAPLPPRGSPPDAPQRDPTDPQGASQPPLGRSDHPAGEVPRRADHRDVRERLREVADEPPVRDVVLLRQEADVVADGEDALEELASLLVVSLQRQAVREPAGARDERTLTTRLAVDARGGVVAPDE